MQDIINTAINTEWLMIVLRSLLILVIVKAVNKFISKGFNKTLLPNSLYIKFIKNILRAIVWIIGISSIASQFPAFSKMANTVLAGSGIVAVIVGMAAQDSFSNIFNGLMISLFKPFDIGDRIKISGDDTAGFVEDITLRHTIIKTYTNVRIIVPNSIMGAAKIENSTFTKGASYPVEVDIAYESADKVERAMEIMENIVMNHPKFFDSRDDKAKELNTKPVTTLVTELGDSGIHLKVLMWTEQFGDNAKACSDCRIEILKQFEKEGIEVTYNKLAVINYQ
jgi:small-conductance mechanosensitive channel